jgi:hypothetical protein
MELALPYFESQAHMASREEMRSLEQEVYLHYGSIDFINVIRKFGPDIVMKKVKEINPSVYEAMIWFFEHEIK